jgi:hypothetical protein
MYPAQAPVLASGPASSLGSDAGGPRSLRTNNAFVPGISNDVKLRRTLLASQIQANHEHLERVIIDNATLILIDDFWRKNQAEARAKALAKLKQIFSGADFQWAVTAKPALACWSYLQLRDAKQWTLPGDHPRDRQQCITVNYLICGKLPDTRCCTKLDRLVTAHWGLQFTWHCLARLVSPERSPLAIGPLATLNLAHKQLLRASVQALNTYRNNFVLQVSEDGGFLCTAMLTRSSVGHGDIDDLYVTAHTWLPEHMATSSYPILPAAIDPDDMLGTYYLLPEVLRVDKGDTVLVPAAALEALQ